MIPVSDAHLLEGNVCDPNEASACDVVFKEKVSVQLIVVSAASLQPFHHVHCLP